MGQGKVLGPGPEISGLGPEVRVQGPQKVPGPDLGQSNSFDDTIFIS